jgi:peptidylprolyl isomerase
MYGAQGNSQLGITAEDTLVIVTDLIGLKKQLVPQAWKNAPKVTFDAKGKPTVKLPDTKPPAQLLLKVLRKGDGAVVKAGDSVTVDYQGTSWNSKKIFDQSYGKQPATFTTDGVVEGFGAALVGQKVGTRLIVSIPPKYAYGEKGAGQELSGQTLVFVIEIKKTEAAAQ